VQGQQQWQLLALALQLQERRAQKWRASQKLIVPVQHLSQPAHLQQFAQQQLEQQLLL
jgi:hypothetical protein